MYVSLAKPIVSNERTDGTISSITIHSASAFGRGPAFLVREVGSRSFYNMSQIML
jgi:hypothetical protein